MQQDCTDFPYLHGFSAAEQDRLVRQARLAESTVFHDIDYGGARRLLEVGSGVGAQTEILLRRFPDLHVTCVDLTRHSWLPRAVTWKPVRGWRPGTHCTGPTPPSCRSSHAASTLPSCAGYSSTCLPRPGS